MRVHITHCILLDSVSSLLRSAPSRHTPQACLLTAQCSCAAHSNLPKPRFSLLTLSFLADTSSGSAGLRSSSSSSSRAAQGVSHIMLSLCDMKPVLQDCNRSSGVDGCHCGAKQLLPACVEAAWQLRETAWQLREAAWPCMYRSLYTRQQVQEAASRCSLQPHRPLCLLLAPQHMAPGAASTAAPLLTTCDTESYLQRVEHCRATLPQCTYKRCWLPCHPQFCCNQSPAVPAAACQRAALPGREGRGLAQVLPVLRLLAVIEPALEGQISNLGQQGTCCAVSGAAGHKLCSEWGSRAHAVQ